MRFIHIADSHCSNFLSYNKVDPLTGISFRFKEQLTLLKQIADYAENNKIEYILHAGDIYDRPNPNDLERTEVEKVLEYIKNKKIRLVAILGNHDIYDNYSSISDKFNHFCTFIEKPCVLDLGFKVVCVPSSKNFKEDQRQYLEKGDVLLIHTTFDGYLASNNFKLKGMTPPDDYTYIAAGHLHKPQQIKTGWYPGSLVRLNFGEKGNDNQFVVYDNGNIKLEKLSTTRLYEFTEETLDMNLVENNIVRVEVENRDIIFDMKKKLADANPLWFGVKYRTDKKEPKKVMTVSTEKMTLLESFKNYCNNYSYSDEVIKLGMSLLK